VATHGVPIILPLDSDRVVMTDRRRKMTRQEPGMLEPRKTGNQPPFQFVPLRALAVLRRPHVLYSSILPNRTPEHTETHLRQNASSIKWAYLNPR
jgi:hypothetical protein